LDIYGSKRHDGNDDGSIRSKRTLIELITTFFEPALYGPVFECLTAKTQRIRQET